MSKPSLPIAEYVNLALEAAERTHDPVERRKHLNIAWRSRLAITQHTVPLMLKNMGVCYDEGNEYLKEPAFEETARQLAQVVTNIDALQATKKGEELLVLIDESGQLPRFTLRQMQSFEEAKANFPKNQVPYRAFGFRMTDEHGIVSLVRTDELTSLGDAGADDMPTSVQIARLPLPWKISSPEGAANPQAWVGTLVVGREAVANWAKLDHNDDFSAVFATLVRALPVVYPTL